MLHRRERKYIPVPNQTPRALSGYKTSKPDFNCLKQALTLRIPARSILSAAGIFRQAANMGEVGWLAPANAGSDQSATLPLSRSAGWTPELGHPMKDRRQRFANRSTTRRLARRGAWQLSDAPHA